MTAQDRVRSTLDSALARMAGKGGLGDADANASFDYVIERPKRAEHGDYATNVAMVAAKKAKKPPRAIAEALVAELGENDVIASAEVAGPGFVNLRLHPAALHAELEAILKAGKAYGRAP
ncbi:MAG TPA: hypothetical protein VF407_20440, partial [Polyangiaceae bacterium]